MLLKNNRFSTIILVTNLPDNIFVMHLAGRQRQDGRIVRLFNPSYPCFTTSSYFVSKSIYAINFMENQ